MEKDTFTKDELKKAFDDARKGHYVTEYTDFDKPMSIKMKEFHDFNQWYHKTYDKDAQCPECGGSGLYFGKDCNKCDGTGEIKK